GERALEGPRPASARRHRRHASSPVRAPALALFPALALAAVGCSSDAHTIYDEGAKREQEKADTARTARLLALERRVERAEARDDSRTPRPSSPRSTRATDE